MIPDVAVFLFIFFIVIGILLISRALMRREQRPRRYVRSVPTEYEEYMDLDIRLPYKRFKELYPYSEITYEEYKKLQMRSAFKKAVSSQENRRMVR